MTDSVAIGVAYRDQSLVGSTVSAAGISNSTISATTISGGTITGAAYSSGTISGTAITGGPGNFTNLTASGNVALGDSSADTFAMYGAAGTTQPTSASQAAVAVTVNAVSALSGTLWGFSSSTQANQLMSLVNQLRSDLVALGLIKGS